MGESSLGTIGTTIERSGKLLSMASSLKGKGLLNAKTKQRGDQYVRFVVTLPKNGDPDLEKVIRDWAKSHPYDVRAKFTS